MGFIIIEGDNGTGKDTIAEVLSSGYGFAIISRLPSVLCLDRRARAAAGSERTAAFLDYNLACGLAAADVYRGCLVRYWISTLAAAFADLALPEEAVLTMASECLRGMPAPKLAVQLTCPVDLRTDRIRKRQIREPDRQDDTTESRAARHLHISGKLLNLCGYPLLRIDTARNTPEQAAAHIATTLGI